MPGPSQARSNYLQDQIGQPTPEIMPAQPSHDPDPVTDPNELKMRMAMMLGIAMGDKYGANPDTPIPQTAPSHPDNQPPTQVDPFKQASLLDSQRAQSSATAPPANGGTIYSGSFAHDLLAALNMPLTYENVRFMNAWMKAETGSQGKGTPAFNPLATTQKFGQYSIFNSVGVKNYADYHTGVMATANVLVNGKYGDILSALSRGNDAMAAARAVAASPWGTGAGVEHVLGGH